VGYGNTWCRYPYLPCNQRFDFGYRENNGKWSSYADNVPYANIGPGARNVMSGANARFLKYRKGLLHSAGVMVVSINVDLEPRVQLIKTKRKVYFRFLCRLQMAQLAPWCHVFTGGRRISQMFTVFIMAIMMKKQLH
jgi:hypothetical protein